ncbi:neutral zinc metallopeptidase [Oleiagrimonas sp. MCCC 1A03011]|uniref:KPN_02809 family neutral zinc metallopeptidase n=1 Tax=Oleiagrimonas sp. MCCC 1A03011 TaxID=1926883 RepID=UPI000DC2A1DF|nr:neutral zinc metallopeptidase [Oleiagrimonas sp. MCCC 1A03011]RAP57573.1 neutral zinc metallopeptidase [Oleiagrimonas sp. MCCC 1A03011]
MLWRKGRRSDNVVRSTGGGRGLRGRPMSIGGLIVMLILGWIFFKDPTALLGDGGTSQSGADAPQTSAPADDTQTEFVQRVLGSTEDVWSGVFQGLGGRYQPPRLVLFRGSVRTACGAASSAVGPFYCPGDRQVYLDVGFFDQMGSQLNASTADFARAYVIAHEVGHHVQNLLGVMRKVDQARARGAAMQGAEGLSVRQELQADCFAGVWANRAQRQLQWLQPGDIEAALDAASHIGDDTLQRRARGRVVPDSFTHGTSAQRVRWFRTGFAAGDIARCNTFAATML